jgi:hypothetical protein
MHGMQRMLARRLVACRLSLDVEYDRRQVL